MPGRPINDQQHRLYITLRQKHPQKTAAAMAGFNPSTGHRAEKDPRLPSARSRDRRHGGGKPDPFAGLWEEEIAPLLRATPGLKPITVLEETRPARSTVVRCALSPSAALTADSRASAVRASSISDNVGRRSGALIMRPLPPDRRRFFSQRQKRRRLRQRLLLAREFPLQFAHPLAIFPRQSELACRRLPGPVIEGRPPRRDLLRAEPALPAVRRQRLGVQRRLLDHRRELIARGPARRRDRVLSKTSLRPRLAPPFVKRRLRNSFLARQRRDRQPVRRQHPRGHRSPALLRASHVCFILSPPAKTREVSERATTSLKGLRRVSGLLACGLSLGRPKIEGIRPRAAGGGEPKTARHRAWSLLSAHGAPSGRAAPSQRPPP